MRSRGIAAWTNPAQRVLPNPSVVRLLAVENEILNLYRLASTMSITRCSMMTKHDTNHSSSALSDVESPDHLTKAKAESPAVQWLDTFTESTCVAMHAGESRVYAIRVSLLIRWSLADNAEVRGPSRGEVLMSLTAIFMANSFECEAFWEMQSMLSIKACFDLRTLFWSPSILFKTGPHPPYLTDLDLSLLYPRCITAHLRT
jgi:hypothetical protein